MQRMDETREKELKALWRRAVAMIYGNVLFTGTPIMVSVRVLNATPDEDLR